MSTPFRQKLNKASYSSSPNRFQVLAPSSPTSPSPPLRPSPSYLQIAGSTPRHPSSRLNTQEFPPFPKSLTQTSSTSSQPGIQANLPSPSSFQPPKKNQYFSKSKKEPIIIIEPEFHNPSNPVVNFLDISKKVFLDNFHYIAEDILKDYKYYEYILIDSESVEIEHNYDSRETARISYSKIKILRVLTPKEFSTNLYTTRTFSNPACLLSYSYLDYKKAWFNEQFQTVQNPIQLFNLQYILFSVSINYSVFQVSLNFLEKGCSKIVSILNVFIYVFFVFIEYSSV